MQSPLTPHRGRIESNPREYTHMGPRLCGELTTASRDIDVGSAAHVASGRYPRLNEITPDGRNMLEIVWNA